MCWLALVCSRRVFFPLVTCKPFISLSHRFSQFLNSLLWFILAYKLAKVFVVPLIFWKKIILHDTHAADRLFDPSSLFKLGIFQKNFALSLDTEVFYPCLQVTSYKTLRSFQMLLELFLQSLQLSWLMLWVFGNFQFPSPLGSRGIPELGLLLEAESHLDILYIIWRSAGCSREDEAGKETLQKCSRHSTRRLVQKCSPPLSLLPTVSVSYRNHAKPCFPAHGRNHLQGTASSFRVQAPFESALFQG